MSDSDSAPEDVTFEAARAVALNHIKDASKAIEEQREKTKNARKRKMEFLKQQKESKMQRMKELESQKLPEDFLEDLASTEATTEDIDTTESLAKMDDVQKRLVSLSKDPPPPQNKKMIFDDQPKEKRKREKIIKTKSTEFKIVTKKDLSSSQYRNNTALNFREAMLFNSKRVKREPHSMKKVRVEKRKAGRIGKEFGV